MSRIGFNDDSELIISLKKGNNEAFSMLYNKYSRGIFRKLFSMVKIKEEAEEMTQEVFVRMWEKRLNIDENLPLIPYLVRIAGNLVADFYRRTAREERLEEALINAAGVLYQYSDEMLLYKESKELIDLAVNSLPEQQRHVFMLVKFEGKSYKEVSEILGIGEATVSTHMVRASKTIKMKFFQNYDDLSLLLAAFLLTL